VIALAFDPVKNPLPKIAIKSRKAATTITLIQTLINRGVPGRENEEIVAACEVLPIGSSVPRSIFMPVASNLRQMMS
jgi:type III secretion system FlhB-like substrate exporter